MGIGLLLAFASALVTNTAYSLQHDAAAALCRRPFRSVQLLLRDRRWLAAFGAETVGWLTYVAALRLALLGLVQAVMASGVAVLAFATARAPVTARAPRAGRCRPDGRRATPVPIARAAALGLAAGLLFADGDSSAKLVGYGGLWLIALATLIVAYAVGTSVLQWAYQRPDADRGRPRPIRCHRAPLRGPARPGDAAPA